MSSHDVLLLLLGAWLSLRSRSFHQCSRAQASHRSRVPRRLKPCSPLDCPACCLASSLVPEQEPTRVPVRPWREIKSRRGAPKRVNTEGVAEPSLLLLRNQ